VQNSKNARIGMNDIPRSAPEASFWNMDHLRGKVPITFMEPSFTFIWVNYNHLTSTSLELWLIRGIIPK
jgi:hypothetical protein